jgi:histidyl-tRNA synthetase
MVRDALMKSKDEPQRTQARLPKGMRDVDAAEIRAMRGMIETISGVYERYGFDPLDTPAFEYTDALGKFLPDTDRPNEGVFSFQDEDEQWLSLRYDLTAPLARYVAQNFDALPKPFRRYQHGWVWRNEKPGPGRFRQFMQFDADTVGAAGPAADAEMCMLAADTLEALGIPRGSYVIKVSNRKILDGVMEAIGLGGPENASRRLIVLRAIDKLDRLGLDGVEQLLGKGRKDESGDFTKGAELKKPQIKAMIEFLQRRETNDAELNDMSACWLSSGYEGRIMLDASVVRGLEYYTGPVFEAELTFAATDEDGRPVRFGSVGGGGRYDGLVSRFRSQPVPATGFSLGVSRLYAALRHMDKLNAAQAHGPVVVLVMDREHIGDYQRLVQELRNAGVRAEMYLGDSGMKAQMKYADRRGAPCVVIQGEDERARGEVQIKDLIEGRRLAGQIEDNAEWREGRPAQISVARDDLVAGVREILARHAGAAT